MSRSKAYLSSILSLTAVVLTVSALTFVLDSLAPFDRADIQMMEIKEQYPTIRSNDYEARYRSLRSASGSDLPDFFISLNFKCIPDSLRLIPVKEERRALQTLLLKSYSLPDIYTLRTKSFQLESFAESLPDSLINVSTRLKIFSKTLRIADNKTTLDSLAQQADALSQEYPALTNRLADLKALLRVSVSERLQNFLPVIRWHSDNRFKFWLLHTLSGDFGTSTLTGEKVSRRIWNALPYSLLASLPGFLLAFLISIAAGIYLRNRYWSLILWIIASIPLFVLAHLFILYFTSSDYLDWFSPRAGIMGNQPVTLYLKGYLLPIICYFLAFFPTLTLYMQASANREYTKPYVQTAKAKGLPGTYIKLKHILANAVFPHITLLGLTLPTLVSGSVLIEQIFDIPGIGKLLYESYRSSDMPVISAIVWISSLFTVLGFRLSNFLYDYIMPARK